jgi:hypothetical protein
MHKYVLRTEYNHIMHFLSLKETLLFHRNIEHISIEKFLAFSLLLLMTFVFLCVSILPVALLHYSVERTHRGEQSLNAFQASIFEPRLEEADD